MCGARRLPVRIHAYGEHMVYAALEGAAVGLEFGLTDEEIIRGIAAYQPVGSRAGVVNTGRLTIIDDCYNANPDSMAAALRSLHGLQGGRKVAILGDMKELGEKERALHREIGRQAAEEGVKLLLTCGPLAADIAAGARETGGVEIHAFETLDALLSQLPALVQTGDSVLVKASHSMQFEKIVDALKAL